MARPRHPALRILLLGTGVVLLVLTPVVGILPGPGGIFLFAGGMALLLQNSVWVRYRYGRAKRRWPKLSALADRAMRRPSARRRRLRDAERAN
jgi:hypothetical protein